MSLSFSLMRFFTFHGRRCRNRTNIYPALFLPNITHESSRSISHVTNLTRLRSKSAKNPLTVNQLHYNTRHVNQARRIRKTILNEKSNDANFVKGQLGVEENQNSVSVAAEMLLQNVGSHPDSYKDTIGNEERIRLEASFAELEELAAVKIRQAHPIIEEPSDSEQSDRNYLTDTSEIFYKMNRSECPENASHLHVLKKKVRFYGTPDPSVPMSNTPCHGCGALLHCQDSGIPGYVPSQKFLSIPESQLKDITCQRCHLLTEHNIAVDVAVGSTEYEAIIAEIKKRNALLVLMIDLTDLSNSFFEAAASMAGQKRPLYIIGNKVDLLPKDDDGYLTRIKESILNLCDSYGLEKKQLVKHIALISAKTGYGIEDLITQLMKDWNRKGQIYLLGCTNAGKSTLFNALLSSDFCRSSARDIVQRATTSIWPGTTLNLLKFPIVNPKPSLLHSRIERLKVVRLEENEEQMLRRLSFKATGHWEHATLMGHIGTSFLTPKEAALEEQLSKYSGFVVPSYTFSDADQTTLEQSPGEDGLVKALEPKVHKYDDSTFKFWCHDTPGYINPEQIINLLTPEELLVLLPKKLIKPRTFVLKPSQVMFVSGLGRIDYSQGDVSIYFTVFASDTIPVHVLKKEEADDFYQTNIGTSALGIPCGESHRLSLLPSLEGKEFTVHGQGWQESAVDVVLSSVGWVSVTAGHGRSVTLKAYTPGGKGCTLRNPPLLKYAVNLRGKRIHGTAAYRTRKHKSIYM